jgi:acyl carrier protein
VSTPSNYWHIASGRNGYESMATTDDLAERVIAVIAATQKIPLERIALESSFEELGIDSLDGLNILFALEEEFDVTIPDEPRGIRSMRQILVIIERLATEGTIKIDSTMRA